MHRSLLALAALAFIASCNEEDPAALFADVSYQLRCLDCEPISPDPPRRDFSVVDGQDGTSLECYSEGGGVTLRINAGDYAFSIIDARLGDDPGSACEIRVIEGGNEYRGACKKVGASGSNPCEVELTPDGSGFTGTVECHQIRHKSNNAWTRHVVAPGESDEPAEISAQGCAGL